MKKVLKLPNAALENYVQLNCLTIDRFKNENIQSKMILQVHDELVFDVLSTELERVKLIVKHEMENVVAISVPLSIEMGAGRDWLAAH